MQYREVAGRLHLIGLAVRPDRQRRGVARALVEHLAVLASQRQRRALSLYTIRQTGNVPVFERLGFRVISETSDELFESVRGDPLSEAYMERRI